MLGRACAAARQVCLTAAHRRVCTGTAAHDTIEHRRRLMDNAPFPVHFVTRGADLRAMRIAPAPRAAVGPQRAV